MGLSKSPSALLAEFHDALDDRPGRARRRGDLAALRTTLHDEEHRELRDELIEAENFAERDPDGVPRRLLEKIARELADVVYVAYGTAHAYGVDLDAAVAEIHRVAMNKLFPTDDSPRVVREDGKVMKPANFTPPDMAGAVR